MREVRVLVHDKHGSFWTISVSDIKEFLAWNEDNRKSMPKSSAPAYWNTEPNPILEREKGCKHD